MEIQIFIYITDNKFSQWIVFFHINCSWNLCV